MSLPGLQLLLTHQSLQMKRAPHYCAVGSQSNPPLFLHIPCPTSGVHGTSRINHFSITGSSKG